MQRSDQTADIGEAFQVLRSSEATLDDSFSQVLEDRMVAEQRKMLRPAGRRKLTAIVVGLGLLSIAGGAASYAAATGWRPWVFSVDAEGTVTNENRQVVGESYDNEDGSTTTVIQAGKDREYRINSDQPINGRKVMIFPAQDE